MVEEVEVEDEEVKVEEVKVKKKGVGPSKAGGARSIQLDSFSPQLNTSTVTTNNWIHATGAF